MTDVDAAQLKVTVKQILQITAFLIMAGLAISSGIWSAVTWKASVDNRVDELQKEQLNSTQEFNKEMQMEDEKLLWIMENMQRRKDAEPFRPESRIDPMKLPKPQSHNRLPDFVLREQPQLDSANSPAYTSATN